MRVHNHGGRGGGGVGLCNDSLTGRIFVSVELQTTQAMEQPGMITTG